MTEDWSCYDPSSFFRLVPISDDELDSTSSALPSSAFEKSTAAPHLVCHSDNDSSTEAETDCYHSEQDDYYCKSISNRHSHEYDDDEDNDVMSTCSYASDLSDLSEEQSLCYADHYHTRTTSMVGVNSCNNINNVSFSSIDPIDELCSELYSSRTLDSLRDQLVECLPQTEAMVSRAIINVFSVDKEDQDGDDDSELTSSCYSDDTCKTNKILQQAQEWARLNLKDHDDDDTQELALSYMQRYIDVVFAQVKDERLASNDAARHLFGIATVLGLEFADNRHDDVPCTGAEF